MRALPLVLLLLAAAPAAAQSVCPIPGVPGRHQSPVDIRGATASTLQRLEAKYPAVAGRSFDTGHNLRVNVAPGDTLTVDGVKFGLLEFHFHWPAEHRFAGDSFPVEIHMVHQSTDGRIAALGTWVRVGPHNAAWDAIFARLPSGPGDTVEVRVNAPSLFAFGDLNAERVYRYCGSLTSPPYPEGLTWLMRHTPITLSQAQIDRLRAVMNRYSRDPQPLYDRVIRYRQN